MIAAYVYLCGFIVLPWEWTPDAKHPTVLKIRPPEKTMDGDIDRRDPFQDSTSLWTTVAYSGIMNIILPVKNDTYWYQPFSNVTI